MMAYMQSALYAITRLSVSPSVHHTGGPAKVVEVMVMHFSHKFHPKILTGSPEQDIKQGWSGKTSYFLALCISILKMVGHTSKVTSND